jgi:fatty acid desaturase
MLQLRSKSPMSNQDIKPIPAKLNVAVACSSMVGALVLLWTASHSTSPIIMAVSVVAFSFVGNTIFACLHECVHGLFHTRTTINETFGCICAAFFPTGLSFQRAAHLGHHQHNRTPMEMFDYYGPSDSRILKTIQWYGIISGVYWVTVPVCWFVYLVCPVVFRPASRHSKWSDAGEDTGVPAYIRALCPAPPLRTRAEILFTIAFQVLLINLLDLTFFGWILCYLAFGLQWSALQYADHAFSPLDVVEGAWDLRVSPVVQAIFLNYHLHLAHHRNPAVPWIHLPSCVDPTRPRPRFLFQYALMWLGPRPLPHTRPQRTPRHVRE